MILIIENQYLPSICLFSYLSNDLHLKFEAFEIYQKGGFRNRSFILGANGVIPLSIPLQDGRTQRKLITEVRISNTTNWQELHWRSIESSYRSSPWFEHFAPELKIFYSQKFELLFDWNLELFKWLIKKLDLTSCKIDNTSDFLKSYNPKDFLDLRNKIIPSNQKTFISKPYSQVFSDRHGFVPNLSILDLLMNEGKMAKNYL